MSRIALVGCGKHMRTTLIPYLRRLEGYEVEVCVDLDETAARSAQQISHAKSWAIRIEDVDIRYIDAALIALPPYAAYQVTAYLVEKRIPCFVEKPPASTTCQIKTLLDLAAAMEVYVQVGFNFRFAEAMAAFHSHIAGHSNAPYIATIEFRSKHPSGPEWGVEDPVAAWLYHNGIHALDLLLWTVGDVQRIHAYISRTLEEKFTIVALMEHANNSVSTLKLGTLTDKFDLRAELSTPEAHQFYLRDLGEVVMPIRNGRVAGEVLFRTSNLDNGWGRAGYGPELQYFLDNYSQYKNSSPSLLDALKASQLCDAIMQSLQKGSGSTLNYCALGQSD